MAVAHAQRDGMFIGTWDGIPIDVFVPSIPFSHEAARTTIRVNVDGWSSHFLSPEAIAIFKRLFFRIKDRGDLERLVAVRGEALDHAYVRRWMIDMMGEMTSVCALGTTSCIGLLREGSTAERDAIFASRSAVDFEQEWYAAAFLSGCPFGRSVGG